MSDAFFAPGSARRLLLSGSRALDFANTVSGRGTPFRVDHLATPESLLVWLVHAELLTDAASGGAERAPGMGTLQAALDMREAIDAAIRPITKGREPAAAALARLRDLLASLLGELCLARAGDGRFEWGQAPAPPTINSALAFLAQSAIDLLRSAPARRLRHCPAADCGRLFLDETKNASRRWCDMAVCGNRTKARRYRGRMACDSPAG